MLNNNQPHCPPHPPRLSFNGYKMAGLLFIKYEYEHSSYQCDNICYKLFVTVQFLPALVPQLGQLRYQDGCQVVVKKLKPSFIQLLDLHQPLQNHSDISSQHGNQNVIIIKMFVILDFILLNIQCVFILLDRSGLCRGHKITTSTGIEINEQKILACKKIRSFGLLGAESLSPSSLTLLTAVPLFCLRMNPETIWC